MPIVNASFVVWLEKEGIDRTSLPSKGEYTFHKLLTKFVNDNFAEQFGSTTYLVLSTWYLVRIT